MASNLEKNYSQYLKKQRIFGRAFKNKLIQLKKFYIPICQNIYNKYKKSNNTLIIGLSGGQGSGKSTMAQIFKIILRDKFSLSVVCFSIDDFYKTKKERVLMSQKVHPLFLTRGVPGTHDHKMIYSSLKNLKSKNFKSLRIPQFDKSRDNRKNKKNWIKIKKKPNIIIFEGWCLGAKSQTLHELKKPVNLLEKKRDTNKSWRIKVNEELKSNYKKIFKLIDNLIYLKVPSYNHVLKWRLLQEKKLRYSNKSKNVMNNKQIKKFIMHFERVTKSMMKNIKKNDIIINLDNQHKIKSIIN